MSSAPRPTPDPQLTQKQSWVDRILKTKSQALPFEQGSCPFSLIGINILRHISGEQWIFPGLLTNIYHSTMHLVNAFWLFAVMVSWTTWLVAFHITVTTFEKFSLGWKELRNILRLWKVLRKYKEAHSKMLARILGHFLPQTPFTSRGAGVGEVGSRVEPRRLGTSYLWLPLLQN